MEHNTPDFAEYRPLQKGTCIPRCLHTEDPGRWIFRFRRSKSVVFLVIISFLLLFAIPQIIPLLLLILLLFLIFDLKNMLCTPVFDFEKKCYYRDFRSPKYGDMSTLKDYLPLSKITGIQLLFKVCRGSKGATWQAYELNIITDDLKRLHITSSKNLEQLRQEGEKLAEKIGVPLKIHDRCKVTAKKTPRWVGILFLVIFTGLGLAAFFFTVAQPLYRNSRAAGWKKTPAIILKSHVDSQRRRSKNGSYMAYKAVIHYRYEFKGQVFESQRYSIFSEDFTRGASEKHRIVRACPPGNKIICRVDPANPEEAVISTRLPWSELLSSSILSLFLTSTGLLAFSAIWKSRR